MAAVSAQSRSKSKARAPARQASVTTTARLHFGFLDPSGRGKRPFGSFGLSLDRPTTRITLERADSFEAIGPERERGLRYLRSIAASSGRAGRLPAQDRGGDPAACGSRLGHTARAGGRLGVCRFGRPPPRRAGDRHKARARRQIRHRHRHLRPRRRRARQRPAPGQAAAACQSPPLPRRMARAADLRCQFERARRGERDGRLRHAPRLSGERGHRTASADH